MSMLLDIHLHTQRHSPCSYIDEFELIRKAIQAGLHGMVITDHHYQWSGEELEGLLRVSGAPGFLLLAGFEYTSARGDMLVYGLKPEHARQFELGEDPERVVDRIHALGGVCVAAHPTRAGLGYDERIAHMALDGIEVASVNLSGREQEMARGLADTLGLRPTASSDAHRLYDVGAYCTEFDGAIQDMADFCEAIREGRFRPGIPVMQRKVGA